MRKIKYSGIEWIGKIPYNWKSIQIKHLFYIVSGATPTSDPDNWDDNIIWITPADYKTKDKYVSSGRRNISLKGFFSCSTSLIPKGSIVFSKRAPIGTVAINTKELCTNQGCLSCVPKANVINDYYYYVLGVGTEHFELLGSGTTFKELSANNFANCKLPFPSKKEQGTIADYLDKKCSEIDALTADIQNEIKTLEEYKRSVITEAVTRGLDPDVEMKDSGVEWVGDIPARWNVHPLYYYLGERKNKNIFGNERNLLSLSYGNIVRKDIDSNGGLLPESFNTYNIVEKGDIIIRPTDLQNDKRSLRTGLVKEHGIITSAYIALKAIKNINVEYVHYLLHSFDIMKVFYNMGNGVRQGLNFSEFSRLQIFEPSIEEQNEIVDYLNRKVSETNSIISAKTKQLETLAEYKNSLIYEYVTGKKEVIEQTTVATAVNPFLVLIGKILDKINKHRGKIQVVKLALLIEYLYIPELRTQYYRYPQGPYDIEIDNRLKEINKLGWFDINIDGNPMDWSVGKNYNEFIKLSQQFTQYDDKIASLINAVGNYTENHIGHIATLFAVWNDFILDGVASPSDVQIVKEVVTNWTENKKNTSETVWHRNLGEMKTKGIIPKGNGLHTKKARR